MRAPKKFWGHPDDWNEDDWKEFRHMERSWNPIDKIKLWLWGY